MLFYVALCIICLPAIIWVFGVLLYVALPHFIFWVLVIGLLYGVGRLIARAAKR